MKKADLSEKRFGRLRVIKKANFSNKHGHIFWLCLCDCGTIVNIRDSHLKTESTKSCGCLNKELTTKRNHKHGDSQRGLITGIYRTWLAMKNRCHNPKSAYYRRYGKRGIVVCDEWKGNFLAFKRWALNNGHRNNLSIDRINNNGNYEPTNCQWLTKSENSKKYWKEDYHDIA